MRETSRIPGLDGLRAIACLAVFAVHLQQMTGIGRKAGPFDFKRLLENGNTGVCLLFMLSGFLLSLPFWIPPRDDAMPRRRGWIGGYTLRRLARIVPAYYLCLTALVLLGRGSGFNDVVLHYAFLHNFTEPTIYSISDPFWTLAVQAQLYVAFAVLMLLLAPLARKRVLVAVLLVLALIAAFAAHAWLMNWAAGARSWPLPKQTISPTGSVIRVSTLAHLPHFLLGMLASLAFASMSCPGRGAEREGGGGGGGGGASVLAEVAAWAAALGTLYILANPAADDLLRIPSRAAEEKMIGRYNFPYVPVLIAVLLVAVPRSRLMRGLLEFSPVRALGVISFGIYVYHLPCLELSRRLLGSKSSPPPGWMTLAAVGLAVSIIVATVSYVAIERPIARWLRGGRGMKPVGPPP